MVALFMHAVMHFYYFQLIIHYALSSSLSLLCSISLSLCSSSSVYWHRKQQFLKKYFFFLLNFDNHKSIIFFWCEDFTAIISY